MASQVIALFSRADSGFHTTAVKVEVQISSGVPSMHLAGLQESSGRESRVRVRSALTSSGFIFPLKRITINLAPAELPKRGSRFDLAIAIGILVASKQLPDTLIKDKEFVGELGLDGQIKGVKSITATTLGARKNNRVIVLSQQNIAAAEIVDGAKILCASSLFELCSGFVKPDFIATSKPSLEPSTASSDSLKAQSTNTLPVVVGKAPKRANLRHLFHNDNLDMKDIIGRKIGRRALEIAAVGRHHLMLIGPPGCGKTMLAKRLQTILPPIKDETSLESAALYDSAGLKSIPWGMPPFRHPHHSASAIAICGGGNPLQPGEISLAHGGILLLDEALEFSRYTLDSLRQPIESGEISLSRVHQRAILPAAAQLVMTMNPCPCGYIGSQRECRCSPNDIRRYINKLSGPLLDRIELKVTIGKIPAQLLKNMDEMPENSESIAERVVTARAKSRAAIGYNAQLTDAEVQAHCKLSSDTQQYLQKAQSKLYLSDRSIGKILRISRTIADLANVQTIAIAHIGEALSFIRLPPPFNQKSLDTN